MAIILFMITDFGTSRKRVYGLLLVNNTNLVRPIFHCFLVIAD